LGPELGGEGHGQVKLALLHEVLGRSKWAPFVFGCHAPDTGNAEILAQYGTAEQKEQYLWPLLNGETMSCYAMTEPHAGSDPRLFTTQAVRDGDDWVINGRKTFTSNANTASFVIVIVVTDPDGDPHRSMSMFVFPMDTPGVSIERDIGIPGEPIGEGHMALIEYTNVRVPASAMLGDEGDGFIVAQDRLGGGRLHHAMRTIGMAQEALDMMCERALSRQTFDGVLADKQFVQGYIADSYAQLAQFRLFVLYTAWTIDQDKDYRHARKDISMVKVLMPGVLLDIANRAMQIHGALGATNEMPFHQMILHSGLMGILDGPTEVHKVSAARQILRNYSPSSDIYPSQHIPRRLGAAREKYAEFLEREVGNS
jgi:acyl-CoA dehydrogenase